MKEIYKYIDAEKKEATKIIRSFNRFINRIVRSLTKRSRKGFKHLERVYRKLEGGGKR
jgi:hypothetical protein